MRTRLIAVVSSFFLLSGPALAAQEPDAPAPSPPPAANAFPGMDHGPEELPDSPAQEADAPAPGSDVVSARRPAILHWWDDPVFDRRVTLVLKNADLNAAIDALGQSANMSLIAAGGSKARKKVTLNLRNAPLRDVMLAMANLYGLLWFKSGSVYTLTYVSAAAKRSGSAGSAGPTGPSRTRVLVVPDPTRPATGGGASGNAHPPRSPNGSTKIQPSIKPPGQPAGAPR